MLDSEPEVMDRVRGGPSRNLFDFQNLISGLDGTGGIGDKHTGINTNRMHERLRKLAETCDSLQGIVIFDSLAGGTGGQVPHLINYSTFPKKSFGSFTLLPSHHFNQNALSPYNTVLNFENHHIDWKVMYDNDALKRACHM
jgi:tubulin alpha